MQIYRTWGQTFITQLVCLYYRCDIPCEWALALWKNAVLWPTWGRRAPELLNTPDGNFNRQHLWTIFLFCFPKIIYIEKIEVVMHILKSTYDCYTLRTVPDCSYWNKTWPFAQWHVIDSHSLRLDQRLPK